MLTHEERDAFVGAILKLHTNGQPQTCPMCFAQVLGADIEAHGKWHKEMQRNLDENRKSW